MASKEAEILEKTNASAEAKMAIEKMSASVKDAKDNVGLLQSIRDAAERGAGSATSSVVFQQNTPAPKNIDSGTAADLSEAVVDIVKETFRDDEFQRTCTSIINGFVSLSSEINRELIKSTNINLNSDPGAEDGAGKVAENLITDCVYYLRDKGEIAAKITLADKVNELIASGVSATVASRLLEAGLPHGAFD